MTGRDKVALVTGAARRVGRAVAMDLASGGYRLAVHYRRSREEALQVVAQIEGSGGQAVPFGADLTDDGAVDRLVADVAGTFGRLDVLVTAAAVFRQTPWSQVSATDWDFHMAANLRATFLLAHAAAPRMADGGSIVTVGDWSGERPVRDYLPYCVSKAGVIALTRALAQELAPRLRVNCVCPATVLPPEGHDPEELERIRRQTPLQRLGSPRDVAAAVRFLVDGSDYVTGAVLPVDGGRLVANSGLY